MRQAYVRVLVVLFVCASGSSLALGASAEDSKKAKELYQKATAHYGVGEYEQAAEAYQESYKLKGDPALLYNAAQSYRLAGRLEKSLTLYRNYTRLYPNEPNIPEVRERIEKVEEQIEADKAAAAAPPPASSMPPPMPAQAPPPKNAAADLSSTNNESDDKPLTSQPWFWGVVGGAVVVTAVVIVVAASSGGSDWANAPEVRQSALSTGGFQW